MKNVNFKKVFELLDLMENCVNKIKELNLKFQKDTVK